LSNDILDDVREPILRKGGVRNRIGHGRPVLAFGVVMVPESPPR
jgi:hypothetical protein